MPRSGMTERGVFMQEVIIGYQGEMSLKGLNRNQFESATIKILRYRLKDAGQFRSGAPSPPFTSSRRTMPPTSTWPLSG